MATPHLAHAADGGLAVIDGDDVIDHLAPGSVGLSHAAFWAATMRDGIESELDGDGPTEWLVCRPDVAEHGDYVVELSTHDYAYAVERLMLGAPGWTLHGCRP